MIPELGQFALILAFVVALIQGVLPLYGSLHGNNNFMAVAKPAVRIQWILLVFAFAALTHSFMTDDFSVRYVVNTSNSHLPMIYKISAVWGGHEGSLLLWALILATWSLLVSFFSGSIPLVMISRVLSILGLIGVGFLLFMIMTSNPFDRIPMQNDGGSLNPLLQDPGLIIHPPMLYMGYVGFSVAFAFAVAAMIGGKLDAAWARWARPWTNVAWVFLTIGIALGSWWAYYELGWGGWWFWDPVENASLLPWLVGTALVHSLVVTEKRGMFKSWTVLLAISAFSLSLLGTFLVRSGVLTSVHSFASDPERGVFILLFLGVVVGGSLTLYSLRASKFSTNGRFELISRETGLLANNIILVVMTAAVLLGTLFPLITDALNIGKISVGPPYFNKIMVPLGIVLTAVMGVGLHLRWKKDTLPRAMSGLWVVLIVSLVMAFLLPLLLAPNFDVMTVVGLLISSWIALSALMWVIYQKRSPFSISGATWGAMLGHIGLAVTFTGITLVSIYNVEKDVRLEPNGSYDMGGYTFTFKGVKQVAIDNYVASRGIIEVTREGELFTTLYPEKRVYKVQTMPMTEAGIDAGLFRDLFVALGEPLDNKGAWSLRMQYKPFVRWIWLGAILMSIGGLLAAFDKRYRKLARRPSKTEEATA
ncbi:MAG: Cytochrome c heme lyase subunit CcmF [uncultured Thiotrichaceae bacterium]|uniref:Cytochrome c heme lyase subunit CcmF n=1 Tax=uncultured Thiotrichaceae bacterium TaxID=298394 RepID=A0A6S6THS5_9GAMM|nr:MAG: Cytochrome c heme lyase subunit CcmF [uncultured Thiotrichaceae bacterium]